MSNPFHLFFTFFCICHLWIIASILLLYKRNSTANRLLALFLILFSFIHIQHAALQIGILDFFPYLDPICGVNICLAFPVFLFYVRSMTGPFSLKDKKNYRHLIIVIPALINLIYLILFRDAKDLKAYYYQESYQFSLINSLLLGGMTLLLLFYLLLSIREIRKYSTRLKTRFSSIEKLKLDWLYLFIGFLLLLVFVIAPFLIIIGLPEWNRIVMGLFTSSLFIGMIYKTFQHQTDEPVPDSENSSIQLNREKEQLLFNQLDNFIKKTKPYLDPELSLKELSKRVGIQPYLVSYLINKKYNRTFFDLINTCRVEEVKQLLGNPTLMEQITIEALAEECGFGSKSAFNNAFKKVTGQTPSQYRKRRFSEAIPKLA